MFAVNKSINGFKWLDVVVGQPTYANVRHLNKNKWTRWLFIVNDDYFESHRVASRWVKYVLITWSGFDCIDSSLLFRGAEINSMIRSIYFRIDWFLNDGLHYLIRQSIILKYKRDCID